MLQQLGVSKVRLLTNNPDKIEKLKSCSIEVVERVPIEVGRNKYNINYLNTKREKFKHMLSQL